MRINHKKYYDDATLEKAARLIKEGKLTLTEIYKELHTSFSTLTRNMDRYFNVSKMDDGETDWKKIYKAKRSIDKQKKKTRIVYECAMCSGESKTEIKQCPRCGSYCVSKRELRNKITSEELRSARMTGHRKKVQ